MKDFVVYTVMVGGYDEIRQPLVVDDRFDYVLFSDQHIGETIGVWLVRDIPYEDDSRLRLSRYPKVHPTKVLPGYKASLYMDANLQIATSVVYDRSVALYNDGIEWAGIKHPHRNCIYTEMQDIIGLRWVHDYDTIDWYCKLKKEGFPANYGEFENNTIFRIHNKNIKEVGDEWWQSLEKLCKRDQFSLMYCIWKVGIKTGFLLPENECAETSKNILYTKHNPHKRVLDLSRMEKLRFQLWRVTPNGNEYYASVFDKLYKFPHPRTALYIWETYALLVYGPKLMFKRLLNR